MNFEFEYPLYFLLLVPIICIYKCPVSAPKRYFVHLGLFSNYTQLINKEKLIYSIILSMIVTALASPITYSQKSSNHRKGRDLVIALDSSGSMGESGYDDENKDVRKFDAVIDVVNDFIKKRFDDNIGVVVFGTYAFASAPLTYDTDALRYVLEFLDVGIAGENTALGEGIEQSIRVLNEGDAKKKVIILLSDGYANSGEISEKDAVAKAKKGGIKIYTIGVGDEKDYDKKLLELIAKESGGEFFKAKNLNELKDVYDELNSIESSTIRSQYYLNKKVLFHIPLFIAISLLIFILLKRFGVRK